MPATAEQPRKPLASVRGMHDLLPGSIALWQRFEATARAVLHDYGFEEIRTPLLERTDLFVRSIGGATDIVEKEMYSFADRDGDSLTLRPEQTASCVRAGIENGFIHLGVHRLWYMGPMFRHERPQKGRFRQFHQLGGEIFGPPGRRRMRKSSCSPHDCGGASVSRGCASSSTRSAPPTPAAPIARSSRTTSSTASGISTRIPGAARGRTPCGSSTARTPGCRR